MRHLVHVLVLNAVLADLLDGKDHVFMQFLVHGELSCLAEGAVTPLEVAFEGFFLRVDVGVLLQVLSQGKSLEAQHADVLLDGLVRSYVTPQ